MGSFHCPRDHFRLRPCAIGAPKIRMAHSGGTGQRVVDVNGAQIGVQWAMRERERERERETYDSNLIERDAYFLYVR